MHCSFETTTLKAYNGMKTKIVQVCACDSQMATHTHRESPLTLEYSLKTAVHETIWRLENCIKTHWKHTYAGVASGISLMERKVFILIQVYLILLK